MNTLDNKNILFIGPEFYDYHIYIIDSLEKKGANVIFLSDKTSTYLYALATKISSKLRQYVGQKYLKNQLKIIENKKFDFIFFIRGELFDIETLSSIKAKNPYAEFIIYQWDSIKNYPHYLSIAELFDTKFSFDKNDCQSYNYLQYMPTFYPDLIDEFLRQTKTEKREKKIDLLFIGSDHGDRYEILEHFKKLCDKNNLVCKFYLYTKFRWWLKKKLVYKIYRNSKLSDFIFVFLSYKEVLNLILKSRVVIDINSEYQDGMTLRTYETLALKSKLLTTNKLIVEQDFFSSDIIKVFDRNNPDIDLEFLKESKTNMDISSYSLSTWIDKVFHNRLCMKARDNNERK